MLPHVGLHNLGENVREHKSLTLAFVRVGEIAEHFADELAVHLALGVAHFLVAHGDAGVAQAELQLAGDAQDGLPAGGARNPTASIGFPAIPGVIARSPASKPCSFREKLQAAPIEPTSNAEGSAPISLHAPDTAACTICGTVAPSKLSELRLMIGRNVDLLHCCFLPQSLESSTSQSVPVTTPPSTDSTAPLTNDAASEASHK